ncbi:hypothetical protein ABZ901_30875 [Actinacidiphila alni]|uniref:hypothetical protein n=1 Tax=Actinacidiphila alni TaxID=380248 RepID=UPI0033D57CA1
MANDHDPRRFFGGERPEPRDDTFRLSDLGFRGGPRDAAAEDVPDDDPMQATVLDPASWSSEVPVPAGTVTGAAAPEAEPVPAPPPAFVSGLRRFGPGVPAAAPAPGPATRQTAAVWHGTVPPGTVPPGTVPHGTAPPGPVRRRGALGGWALPLVVLLGALAFLLWQRWPGPSVRVDAVSVRSGAAVQGCHSTAKVTGTLRTGGGAGTVRYRWRRSDGTVSDELTQHVGKGRRSTEVTLLWSFDGRGSFAATVTLEVLGPQRRSASGTFTYRCG